MKKEAQNYEENWSTYWQQDGAGGEVFVGSDGEGNSEIADFWRSIFADVTNARIIDIACGAGSVLGHVPASEMLDLVGADVSIDALRLLKSRNIGAGAVVASAIALPFPKHSFDLVVSQFGIEYAGVDAFARAFELLKPGGRFSALSHVRDGYIDSKNAALQAGVQKVVELDFIVLARQLTRAAYSGIGVDEAVRQFQPAEKGLALHVIENPGGFHGHLYGGFRQLFERRARYDESDITGWLDGMASELTVNQTRLNAMRKAALSESCISKVRSLATQLGVQMTVSEMTLAGQTLPVAWRIDGRKD